jgi:hypothetical protein
MKRSLHPANMKDLSAAILQNLLSFPRISTRGGAKEKQTGALICLVSTIYPYKQTFVSFHFFMHLSLEYE